MNKTRIVLISTLLAAAVLGGPPALSPAWGDMRGIFLEEMDRAVQEAVQAWIRKDPARMQAAMERLVLNETYSLAVGRSDARSSYLTRLPRPLADNLNATAAYLFLVQCERRGHPLWPSTLFQGKEFVTELNGGSP